MNNFLKRHATFRKIIIFALVIIMNVQLSGVTQAAAGDIIVGYSADNVIPTAQLSQATDGSGIVTVTFKLKDPDTVASTLLTFEYSVNGGEVFAAPTNGDASDSLYKTAAAADDWDTNGATGTFTSAVDFAGTAHSFLWNTKHADLTGLNSTAQSDVQVQFKANDGAAGGFGISESFAVDNLNPATLAAADIVSRPAAGATTVTLSGTVTETNPNTNNFALKVNGGSYTGNTAGTTNTATPANTATAAEVTLDGDDCITAVKLTHADDLGNSGTNENTDPSTKCVTPYTPSAPTNTTTNPNIVKVVINQGSETGAVEYAIYETFNNKYVQTTGALGTSAAWQTYTNWGGVGGVNVTGLLSDTNYRFSVKARNPQDTTVEGSLSSTTDKRTQSDRPMPTTTTTTTPTSTSTTTTTETTTQTDSTTTTSDTSSNTSTDTTADTTTTTDTTDTTSDTSSSDSSSTVKSDLPPGLEPNQVVVKSRDSRATVIAEGESLVLKTETGTESVALNRLHLDLLHEKFTPRLFGPIEQALGRPFISILKGPGANALSKEGGALDHGTVTQYEIRFQYLPEDLKGFVRDDLEIFYWDPSKETWTMVDNAWHDGMNDRFILQTTELGVYVIGVRAE